MNTQQNRIISQVVGTIAAGCLSTSTILILEAERQQQSSSDSVKIEVPENVTR